MWLSRHPGVLLLLILLLAVEGARSQQSSAPAEGEEKEPEYQFFSGSVVEFSEERLTVRRAVRGQEERTQTFLLRPETRIEGRIAVDARVTVGFQPSEAGDVAVRVIVRSNPDKSKAYSCSLRRKVQPSLTT